MNSAKRACIALVVAIFTALSAARAGAQQATPSAPLNPNWCSQAPSSPPPPQFEHKPGQWAAVRQICMNVRKADKGCADLCQTAEDLWNLQKSGRLNQPNTWPSHTDKPLRPFPLPGGASGYVVPAQPAPTPAPADAAPSQSSVSSPSYGLARADGKPASNPVTPRFGS